MKGGASLFVAGLGVPREIIEVLHDGNVLVASMCGKVRHAIAAVEAGCDFVIAQGTEAGGHTGTVATLPLVPQIVDEVGDRVPGGRGRRHLRRAWARGRARARRRRRVDRHSLHRDARSAHGSGLQGSVDPHARGRHGHQQGLHGQDVARGAQRVDAVHRRASGGAAPVPRADDRARSRRRRCTSVATRRPTSTPTRSATRRGRASARSTRSSPPVISCGRSSTEAERALHKASSYA